MASREKQLLDSIQGELHSLATEAKKKSPALKVVRSSYIEHRAVFVEGVHLTSSHPLPATLYDPLAGEGSYFDKYITRTLAMTPEERAVALEEDDEVGVAGYGCPCPPPCC